MRRVSSIYTRNKHFGQIDLRPASTFHVSVLDTVHPDAVIYAGAAANHLPNH